MNLEQLFQHFASEHDGRVSLTSDKVPVGDKVTTREQRSFIIMPNYSKSKWGYIIDSNTKKVLGAAPITFSSRPIYHAQNLSKTFSKESPACCPPNDLVLIYGNRSWGRIHETPNLEFETMQNLIPTADSLELLKESPQYLNKKGDFQPTTVIIGPDLFSYICWTDKKNNQTFWSYTIDYPGLIAQPGQLQDIPSLATKAKEYFKSTVESICLSAGLSKAVRQL